MLNHKKYFFLQEGRIYAIPVIHYSMEFAAHVRLVYDQIKPDCIAVELAETMQLQLLHAASRLPDISVVSAENHKNEPIYYLSEPCDPAFEGLRLGLENKLPAYCIDLDVDYYPEIKEWMPDPYSIHRIGLNQYYSAYQNSLNAAKIPKSQIDADRELYMAKRLKELSLSYERILFIGGMFHVENILKQTNKSSFPSLQHAKRAVIQLSTLTEDSCREVMAECGWISSKYEEARKEYSESLKGAQSLQSDPGESLNSAFPPDRQKFIFQLYKEASDHYKTTTGNTFPSYNLRNTMKFMQNYALISGRLMPDLFQILSAAKGCVDHNYAYEVWLLGTEYPYRKNIDNLPELKLSIQDIWGHSKMIHFHLKQPGRKNRYSERKRKDKSQFRFQPPGPFSICSFPPEDVLIERFGDFIKKKGTQILTEEAARTAPFSSNLEDGIDTKETIRHWPEKKLYIKIKGKPPGGVGSIVIIFDEDSGEEVKNYREKYPWKTTWLGEHNQESDMSFYGTNLASNVVGPGISRCEYGGFLMSYPPRRLLDVWSDPDYDFCRTKSEVLLMAAIDYAIKPIVVYVAAKPPRSALKSFAKRFGKKIVYVPIGQLSPITLNKLRIFHVLDGHDKRQIADEYIY
jgi:hypothetical protein